MGGDAECFFKMVELAEEGGLVIALAGMEELGEALVGFFFFAGAIGELEGGEAGVVAGGSGCGGGEGVFFGGEAGVVGEGALVFIGEVEGVGGCELAVSGVGGEAVVEEFDGASGVADDEGAECFDGEVGVVFVVAVVMDGVVAHLEVAVAPVGGDVWLEAGGEGVAVFYFAPLVVVAGGGGFDGEDAGDEGAEAAEDGEEAVLAEFIAEGEGDFALVGTGGAEGVLDVGFEGEADGAEGEEGAGDDCGGGSFRGHARILCRRR